MPGAWLATRKFETSHVGGATGRTPPIPRSALEKDPRPGPLFVGGIGGKRRRGQQKMRWLHGITDSMDIFFEWLSGLLCPFIMPPSQLSPRLSFTL